MKDKKAKVLITGGSGWIASNLIKLLNHENLDIHVISRNNIKSSNNITFHKVNEEYEEEVLNQIFKGVDVLVHLAGIAHQKEKNASKYKLINEVLTYKLAKLSSKNKVKRFVFISSAKVKELNNDNEHILKRIFKLHKRKDFYATSKFNAEKLLNTILDDTLEIICLRPPLVYGEGVKANFNLLMRAASYRLPLPLRGLKNVRKMIFIGNLVACIKEIIYSPKTLKGSYYVCDDFDISTSDLYDLILIKKNRSKLLNFYLPKPLLSFISTLFFQRSTFKKLSSEFLIDNNEIKNKLGWEPPFDETQVFNFLEK